MSPHGHAGHRAGVHVDMAGCAAGTAVTLVSIDRGGHTWFAQGLGPANGAVDATGDIWSFLAAVHRSA